VDLVLYPDSLKSREKTLAFSGWADSGEGMIQGGFLSKEDRSELIAWCVMVRRPVA
jgi:hypothetical protein